MAIDLQLKHHCIQTAARRAYERLVNDCLKPSPAVTSAAMASDLEGLKFFLETCDFAHMRNSYPELSGREEVSVTLDMGQDRKQMMIVCRGRRIHPKWKGGG